MGITTTTSASGNSAQTILLVEAGIVVRSTLAEYLRHCGYRVFEATNAIEAKAILNFYDGSVNLVFSGLNLPGEENGFSLARWVRDTHPGIEVLLASGTNDAAEKAGEVCEKGPNGKPYGHQDVLYQIQQQLQRAGKTDT